ncbi:hypothetical protein SAMN04489867_0160 [Pedococcus dokdonensis]|uniref:Uncharacterized protein n=1 Tax=Pedococcus dokdonensis TaxID=443156 RepID=A0A1H0KZZ5_9MICO|nr:hypothetical protein [Pedococcus dokdonensis]SDO61604.1 hypothetical protein SAMN04489867_0160 [Pedococcus dokdonensis]
MENITMTIDATHMSRVRSVCPEAGRVLLAGSRGWAQGTTVPAPIATLVIADAQVPTYVGGFGATKDLAFRPFGEPPV